MYQLGWFSTGRDREAVDLLSVVNKSIKRGDIKAQIDFVFCNREPGESGVSDVFITVVVMNYHIFLEWYSSQKFKEWYSSQKFQTSESTPTLDKETTLPLWRLDYDREVMKRLQRFNPDLYVLAGYMLIVGKEMCQRYNMINLHPAAPGGPTGTWQKVIWQLIDNEAQETGVMMHLVTPELYKGPPVTYCTFSIRDKPFDRYWQQIKRLPVNSPERDERRHSLFWRIRSHGLARECPLIVATLKAFSQGKIKITTDKKVVDSAGNPIKGYNLTEEIDAQVKEVLSYEYY